MDLKPLGTFNLLMWGSDFQTSSSPNAHGF